MRPVAPVRIVLAYGLPTALVLIVAGASAALALSAAASALVVVPALVAAAWLAGRLDRGRRRDDALQPTASFITPNLAKELPCP